MSDAVPAWFGPTAIQHLSQPAAAAWTHQDPHAPDVMDVDAGQDPKEVVAALRARGAQDLESWSA
jgi:hypothetical protein